VAVALGSNLGDRHSLLTEATARLSSVLTSLRASTFHDTVPVGVPSPQPNYLNAVVVGETTLTARELLAELLAIERTMGRTRPHAGAPRTIDLDLILYGTSTVDEPGLTVPHPRFRERGFVLAPLCEIAPEMIDPVSGETAAALLDRL
jgi:2-amino-4-hydroxy-6-hydroxymethyldihydropteridine diphosphokinase